MSWWDAFARKEGLTPEQEMQLDSLHASGQMGERPSYDIGSSMDMPQKQPSQLEAMKPTQDPSSGLAGTAGKGAMAGAMGANPWVIGGAAAMDVYQQYENRKQQERIAEYEAKLNKIRSMQQSLGNAAQMAGRISYT